jgi:hypothetical protein
MSDQPDLATLMALPDADSMLNTQLAVLSSAEFGEFPVTAWQPGSVPLALLNSDRAVLLDLTTVQVAANRGGFLMLADGTWKDLWAKSQYDLERLPGQLTRGTFHLSDVTYSSGPFTIEARGLVVECASGAQFTNLAEFTLASGGTCDISVELLPDSVDQGPPAQLSQGNLSILQAGLTIRSPSGMTTVAVTNPAISGATTWITQLGRNEESDASLEVRCQAKWPGLGGGATATVYRAWAIESTDDQTPDDRGDPQGNNLGIARASAWENTNGAGAESGGHVLLVVAGDVATVSSEVATQCLAYINQRRPLCVTVHVNPATQINVTLGGRIYVTSASLTTALVKFARLLVTLSQETDSGDTIRYSAVAARIHSLSGVQYLESFVINSGTSDIVLAKTQVASFVSSVTWWDPSTNTQY